MPAPKCLPPYLQTSEVARAVGWSRKRAARMLAGAKVSTLPPGRAYRVVSTELLRLHLPEVYEALLDA